ncbi:Porphobilinogen synthase [Thermodesulfatator indicus DSM 15286]|uniref:Delta-aminolevulinic acid dehydratase n=1 Tax=Thermodesulfatator indicus (strain DSM 15286 / JCM 11887 / CIR29812) TaxID=667014 RepID=F8A9B1_THEID|nr:porphobilinogen synthase [Thermodesulfatator indicus]AEH45541.1 Porphobilinogen synthase [Thermodesulfatator indicus DSM 15286]
MFFPEYRPRRLRRNETLRSLVRETELSLNHLIYPLFVVEGHGIKEEVPSMPGVFRFSVDLLKEEIKEIIDLGLPAVILFGIPAQKDEIGSEAYAKKGVVQRAISAIKKIAPELLVITDVCLCEYTSHGHCGIIKGSEVDNDLTLEQLARVAVSHAKAGADMVAPSDMMDGRVARIREALDEAGFSHIPIMSYAVKYCSSFYGPFRDAAESAPQFGDRRSYQMDPANVREALREATLDVEEGADILMVKPAMPYLDVITRLREEFNHPIAAYQVSGEYAMIKAAGKLGWLDEERAMMESLISIRRAGADIILTYFAKEIAKKLAK